MTLIEVNTHFIVCISQAVITFSPITTANKLIFLSLPLRSVEV